MSEQWQFYIQHIGTGMVLDVKDSCVENGAELMLYNHHGGNNQLWTCRDGLLCSVLGYNLVLDVNETKGKLGLWEAHGGPTQKWTFNKDFTIVNGLGHAIDIKGGWPILPRDAIIPWTRHGGWNQRFRLVAQF